MRAEALARENEAAQQALAIVLASKGGVVTVDRRDRVAPCGAWLRWAAGWMPAGERAAVLGSLVEAFNNAEAAKAKDQFDMFAEVNED